MTTDDFLRDQMERTQREQTRRRRDGTSRRRRFLLLAGGLILILLILSGPILISHSSIGRTLLTQAAAGYGLDAKAESISVGWITPLRVSGLHVRGNTAGSELVIDQLDTELTVRDLIGSSNQLGTVVLRGVHLACTVSEGRCSLEEDLQTLLSGEGGGSDATFKVQEASVSITDATTGEVWQIAQSNAEVSLAGDDMQAAFAGVLSEPSGSGGSLQGSVTIDSSAWQLDLESESLPLSVVTLVRRRFSELASSIPEQVSGDATGGLRLVGATDGTIEASARGIQIRDLTAADQGSRLWNNQLATINGDLILQNNRVVGRDLRATTDFASATIDAAVSRSLSLAGANDNPVRWFEALDGSATAEIDLALLDRALPGLLPLKDGAQIVSGRAIARLDSLPASGGEKRSQLTVLSDELRARSRGQGIVIDKIRLDAIVSTDNGSLTAERFEWKSSFASAVGRGDLRSGNANVQIDFGRLSSILRPIFDISSNGLTGTARGDIGWNASRDNVWRLSGSGDASNLLITLPSGQTLERASMRGAVEAVGRWGGQSLEELTSANVTLSSSGLKLRADLTQAVTRPSRSSLFPIHVTGDGRIETLAELMSPWLPKQLHDSEGGFSVNARGFVSADTSRLTMAAVDLSAPRVAYADRYFSQPEVAIYFDGQYDWPSGDVRSDSFTVKGNAFSLAAIGTMSSEVVDMDLKWLAKLERIQGSVRRAVASRTDPTMRQVGFRSGETIKSDDWLVVGDCKGSLGIRRRGKVLELDTQATGKDLAIIQPPGASAGSRTMGPMPRPTRESRSANPSTSQRVVWSEPNLQINGVFRLDQVTGRVTTDSVQLAADWFATNLTGHALWNESIGDVSLRGPAKLKMTEVARVLSSLSGTSIVAQGIHETPLEIRAFRRSDGAPAFDVSGNLGWEAAEVAGVQLGQASIPVHMNETSVVVAPSAIAVGQGQVNLAGEVHYRPGPLWMRVQPGVIARSVRLTPKMTNRWMKYLAPLVADATNIDGTFSAAIDEEAVVVIEQPELSRVVGRLDIEGARMTAGPLANQISGGIKQLKAIARASGGGGLDGSPSTLIELPTQTVEFMVDRGVVSHKTLFLEIDRAQVVTSGRVALDGRLDMVAQVVLDERWLGSDLRGLAGQTVTLPIDGTLSRPSLDSSGVRKVVTQLGVQAAQSIGESYLQKQLNRQFEKILGR